MRLRDLAAATSTALALLLLGCGTREAAKSIPAADSVATTAPMPRAPRDSQFDEMYLSRQAERAHAVREQLDAWKHDMAANRGEYRELILKRKGELLFAQKDVRNSQFLSTAQRDSLLAPLDSEAIELAEELITLK